MIEPQDAPSTALSTFFYLSPAAAICAFLTAKLAAACVFAEPSPTSGKKRRRYTAAAFQFLILLTVIAEGISLISVSLGRDAPSPPQPYVSYLVLQGSAQAILLVAILDDAQPLWLPFSLSWLANFVIEIPLIYLHASEASLEAQSAKLRVVLEGFRVALFLVQSVVVGVFMLLDRRRVIKLDSESAALLANADGVATEETNGQATESAGADGAASDDSAEADGYDEVDKKDLKRKAEHRKRMKEAGSIWNYMKPYKVFIPLLIPRKDRLAQLCLSAIGLVIIAERFLNILLPRQLGIVVNELTLSAGSGVMPWGAIGLWILYSWLNSSMGLDLIKSQAELVLSQYTYHSLSTKTFGHIMGLSMDFHTGKSSGELITAMDQGHSLQDLVTYIFFSVLPMMVDLVVAVFYVYNLFDVYMALILLGAGMIYTYIGLKLTAWGVESRRRYTAARRKERSIQNEAINNWATVSHFNRVEYEADRFSNAVTAYNHAEWWFNQLYYLGGNAQSLVMLMCRILALLLAMYRVSQGTSNVGDFINLNAYWRSLEYPLDALQFSVRRISGMLIDSERLLELFNTKSSVQNTPGAPPLDVKSGEVEFKDVNFAYDPRRPTLVDISFNVRPGQTVAFVGETGGGKSTILKLLYRYYDVGSGSILIDGQDLRSVDLDNLRESFGMVPQDPSLFNLTLLENLRYARLDATDEEIRDACRAAAIHTKIESFPDGYKTVVGERGMKLSGGEMQRVAIARAFLRNAKIVLLDEATSQIDAETEEEIQVALKRLMHGRTTFVVAHRLATIQHADVIIVVQDGRIIQKGTHDELWRDEEGKYRSLWKRQMHRELAEKGEISVDEKGVEGNGEGSSQGSSKED